MPNINDVFASKFLKAHELQGKEPRVTIERVEFEPVGRSREMKAIAYFVGKEKGMVLNKTNATKIATIAGSSITEDWPGTIVQLFATEADFGGETYDVVRIKAPMAAARPAPKPRPLPVAAVATGTDGPLTLDDIPF